jgi:hypothetical protein
MDSRRSPQRIGDACLADQPGNFYRHTFETRCDSKLRLQKDWRNCFGGCMLQQLDGCPDRTDAEGRWSGCEEGWPCVINHYSIVRSLILRA